MSSELSTDRELFENERQSTSLSEQRPSHPLGREQISLENLSFVSRLVELGRLEDAFTYAKDCKTESLLPESELIHLEILDSQFRNSWKNFLSTYFSDTSECMLQKSLQTEIECIIISEDSSRDHHSGISLSSSSSIHSSVSSSTTSVDSPSTPTVPTEDELTGDIPRMEDFRKRKKNLFSRRLRKQDLLFIIHSIDPITPPGVDGWTIPLLSICISFNPHILRLLTECLNGMFFHKWFPKVWFFDRTIPSCSLYGHVRSHPIILTNLFRKIIAKALLLLHSQQIRKLVSEHQYALNPRFGKDEFISLVTDSIDLSMKVGQDIIITQIDLPNCLVSIEPNLFIQTLSKLGVSPLLLTFF
jgi:hypothetical protein